MFPRSSERSRAVAVLAGALLLGGGVSGCALETRDVEVPVRGSAVGSFTLQGSSLASNYALLDLTALLQDLEAGEGFAGVRMAAVESGHFRILRNGGSPDLEATAAVTIAPEVVPGSAPAQAGVLLFSHSRGRIAELMGPFRSVPLEARGVAVLDAGLQAYIAWRNGPARRGEPAPRLVYRLVWAANTWSASGPPVTDLDVEARLRLVLVGRVEVEVPQLF